MPVALRVEVIRRGAWPTGEQMDAALARGLQKAGFVVQRRAQQNLTGRMLRVQTGRLRSSLTVLVGRGPGGPEVLVGTNVRYGAVHEFGAPPYEIRPRRRKVLRFLSRGAVVFARRVQHPGHRARRWLRTAGEESRTEIERAIRGELAAALLPGALGPAGA